MRGVGLFGLFCVHCDIPVVLPCWGWRSWLRCLSVLNNLQNMMCCEWLVPCIQNFCDVFICQFRKNPRKWTYRCQDCWSCHPFEASKICDEVEPKSFSIHSLTPPVVVASQLFLINLMQSIILPIFINTHVRIRATALSSVKVNSKYLDLKQHIISWSKGWMTEVVLGGRKTTLAWSCKLFKLVGWSAHYPERAQLCV